MKMRKSLIMGTKADVVKMKAKRQMYKTVTFAERYSTSEPVNRIVTFNHPILKTM